MAIIDYSALFAFTLMVLMVGLAFTRTSTSLNSFFAAGGDLPWWLSGLSLFMSFFSAGTFVVWGSIAYEYGWVAVTIQWMMGLGGIVIGFFIAPRWKKTHILTVGEYIGNRFGTPLKKFYSYIFLLLSFVSSGAFLYPVAKLFNVSTGFSIEGSILGLGLLIIIYTAAGGLWAVVITDVLQFVILFAAVLIVVPLSVDAIGGMKSFIQKAPADFFSLTHGEYTAYFLIAFLLYNTIFIGGNWAYVQRYTSVKNPKDARKVAWLFAALYLVSPVLWMLPPMIYRSLEGGLTGLENEGAFLLMCKEVLPGGLLGLMLGGMIFATASSVNTTLNMSAAVFTHDLFKKLKGSTPRPQLMRTARISTVIFGLITIGFALLVPRLGGIVEVVLSIGAITGAPLFAPPIWSLFSKRQTAFSIIITTLTSLSINLFFKFISPIVFAFSLDRAAEMLVGVWVPLGILAVFEILLDESSQPSPNDSILATPTEKKPATYLEPHQNKFALRILSFGIICTGIMICLLGWVAGNGQGIAITVGIGTLIMGIILAWKKA